MVSCCCLGRQPDECNTSSDDGSTLLADATAASATS